MKCAKCKDSGLTYEEVMGIMTVKQIYCDCEQGVKKKRLDNSMAKVFDELNKDVKEMHDNMMKDLYGCAASEMTNSNTRSEHLELLIKELKKELSEKGKRLRVCYNDRVQESNNFKQSLGDTVDEIRQLRLAIEERDCEIADTQEYVKKLKVICEMKSDDNTTLQNEIGGLRSELKQCKYDLSVARKCKSEPAKDFDYPCVVEAKDGLLVWATQSENDFSFVGTSLNTVGCNGKNIHKNNWAKCFFKQVEL